MGELCAVDDEVRLMSHDRICAACFRVRRVFRFPHGQSLFSCFCGAWFYDKGFSHAQYLASADAVFQFLEERAGG